jgi:GTP:adenosylcobinamide-phosphate guanylyltransferase
MDAILTAGGIPQPGEPLYEYTQGINKALLDISGKPMIQWVLDALEGANGVERIIIIGLPADTVLTCSKVAAFVPTHGSMLENIRAGVNKVMELNPDALHVLAVSSDIPGITPEMVDWVINTTMETDHDVYYNIITRQVMEARYPDSRRSYTHLKEFDVCGGDMNVIRTSMVTGNDSLWEEIIAARKNVFKQASLIGFSTLILLLLRRINLDSALKRVSERLNLRGRAIVCPYAEVGMDVDKPHQLEIMRADLQKRVTT